MNMKTYGFPCDRGLRNILVKYRVIDSLLKNYDPYRNEFMAKSPSAIKGDGQIHGKKKKKRKHDQ